LWLAVFVTACGGGPTLGYYCSCADADGVEVSGLPKDGVVCEQDGNAEPAAAADAAGWMEEACEAGATDATCACDCGQPQERERDDGSLDDCANVLEDPV